MALLYATEVCTDIALGAVAIVEDLFVLLQDFVTPIFLDSPLTPQGVFALFGLLSIAGYFFVYFYVAETMGLSEKEKKEVYLPGAKYGRQIREGEPVDIGEEHQSAYTRELVRLGSVKSVFNTRLSRGFGSVTSPAEDLFVMSTSKEDVNSSFNMHAELDNELLGVGG